MHLISSYSIWHSFKGDKQQALNVIGCGLAWGWLRGKILTGEWTAVHRPPNDLSLIRPLPPPPSPHFGLPEFDVPRAIWGPFRRQHSQYPISYFWPLSLIPSYLEPILSQALSWQFHINDFISVAYLGIACFNMVLMNYTAHREFINK